MTQTTFEEELRRRLQTAAEHARPLAPSTGTNGPTRGSTVPPAAGRRSSAAFVGVAAVAAAALVILVVLAGRDGQPDAVTTSPGPTSEVAEDAWSDIGESWTPLWDGPSGRVFPSVVWTGQEVVVWGGETESEAAWTSAGAAYDPFVQAWRELAESPLSPRSAQVAVWSGSEVLVCCGRAPGGDDRRAAAYDPEQDSWRSIADPPFDAESAVAAWTGTEMIVAGGTSNREAFAYQPSNDAWRQLSSPPKAIERGADVAWTGEVMIVWPSVYGTTPGLSYHPASDQWSDLPPLPPELDIWGASMVWTGTDIIVWGNSARVDSDAVGARLRLGANTWTPVADDPLDPFDWWEGIPGSNSAIWTGSEMLVWAGAMSHPSSAGSATSTRMLAYNPAEDSWRDLSEAPAIWHGPDLVWTGQVVVALTDPIIAMRPDAGP